MEQAKKLREARTHTTTSPNEPKPTIPLQNDGSSVNSGHEKIKHFRPHEAQLILEEGLFLGHILQNKSYYLGPADSSRDFESLRTSNIRYILAVGRNLKLCFPEVASISSKINFLASNSSTCIFPLMIF